MTETRSLWISPKYSVDDWHGLELDSNNPKQDQWVNAVMILQDRIEGRFLKPAQALIDAEKDESQPTFGFAILALDFLVLETIQGFKEGKGKHTGDSTRLFKAFLTGWKAFTDRIPTNMELNKKAGEFFDQGRCALHHSGTTDKMTVGISGDMVTFHEDSRIDVNRTRFHQELVEEFEQYLAALKDPDSINLRKNFQAKMNAICGED
ncbi:hypothetical protein G6L08_22790 [Agrobacterium rhizogenes]|nr:hypothetical protein [Rhizobium rhizogenes]